MREGTGMTHPNAELLRTYLATLSAGKAIDAIQYFTEDCALHVPGRSPHAGTYRGQEAVLEYYTRVFQDTGGKFENLGVDDILASDTHAASLVHWRVTRRDRTIDVDRVVIYRIVDGRIAEAWVRDWDQYAYDELFAE
jgi:ketosteroid isomerase-like protein